jgi:hypothetical protein
MRRSGVRGSDSQLAQGQESIQQDALLLVEMRAKGSKGRIGGFDA